MNKRLTIIMLLCWALVSCRTAELVLPTEAEDTFTTGYALFYGDYYNYLNIPENVVALSLFSKYLSTDSAGYYVGNGTHLILSDIFIAPTDTLLPAGHYTVSEEGYAMTFLDGKSFDGNLNGSYMVTISESGVSSEILTDGSFDLEYKADSVIIQFNFMRSNGKVYSPTYRGLLPTYDARQ